MKLALNSDPCFAHEEPFTDALQNMCSKNFTKFTEKIPGLQLYLKETLYITASGNILASGNISLKLFLAP